MKRFAIWLLIQVLFYWSLIAGAVYGVEGALRIAMFFAWVFVLAGILTLFLVPEKLGDPESTLFPPWFSWINSLLKVTLFVWAGAMITGAAYFLIQAILILVAVYNQHKKSGSSDIEHSSAGTVGD